MVQQQKGPAAAEPKQFIFQFYPLLRIHIHIHDPGHDQVKPGSRIGKPCCKERQHHVRSGLSAYVEARYKDRYESGARYYLHRTESA